MSESDNSLIAEFNARYSEDAFAALVRQHVHLVYGTALRQVGDAGGAEEITQNVFVALAQAAGRLGSHPTIAGWLHQTTLNKSRAWLRAELRRRKRERVAVNLETSRAEGDSVWSPLVPLLDEALLKLRGPDRQALILHYLEGRTFEEVGSTLGVGQDAARKRVNRSLDELTDFFRRRGFAVPALSAGAPLFALAARTAPTGLAGSATAAGLAAHSTTSTLTLVKGALRIMAWTKAKTAIVAGIGVLFAGSVTTGIVCRHAIAHRIVLHQGRSAIAHHTVTPIDLNDAIAHYGMPASNFTNSFRWKDIPTDFQVFNRVPFQIDGAMFLWGSSFAKAGWTEQISVPVNQKFQTVYLLHTAFHIPRNGTPVYQVVFHYENDLASVTNTMLYGQDILDWYTGRSPRITGPRSRNSRLAWVGGAFAEDNKSPLILCLTAVTNPLPGLTVTSIDLNSCKGPSGACILAMTTGRSGLLQ